MSRTFIFVVVPVVIAAVGYGAFIFVGARIDGRRQAVREKGLHPVTEPDGSVEGGSMSRRSSKHVALASTSLLCVMALTSSAGTSTANQPEDFTGCYDTGCATNGRTGFHVDR